MPLNIKILLLVILCLSACNTAPDFYLGGIMINEANHQHWVESLEDVGMNTVSVTVYARQGIWDSDNIWWNEEESSVVHEIETAKAQGLNVVLILRVLLDSYFEENKFLWHGMTMPANDSLLTNWFENYGMFVDKWAKEAERLDVDVLAVGSELRALSATLPIDSIPVLEEYYLNIERQEELIEDHQLFEKELQENDLWVRGYGNYSSLDDYLRDKIKKNEAWASSMAMIGDSVSVEKMNHRRRILNREWEKLIHETRGVYHGELTYAANFDNYRNVGFWKTLDFIGINAYFKMREPKEEANLEGFEQSWTNVFADLDTFCIKQSISKPKVLFTELGYVNRSKCSVAPWQGFGFSIVGDTTNKELIVWGRETENYIERSQIVEALHNVYEKDEGNPLGGILYWKLTSDSSLLKYEPFGLWSGLESQDPLLKSLQKFSTRD